MVVVSCDAECERQLDHRIIIIGRRRTQQGRRSYVLHHRKNVSSVCQALEMVDDAPGANMVITGYQAKPFLIGPAICRKGSARVDWVRMKTGRTRMIGRRVSILPMSI